MHRHTLARQQRAHRLRHVERGRFGNGVAGDDRDGRERHHRQVVDDGSLRASQKRQESPRHIQRSVEVNRQVLLDERGVAQIVIERDAGVVDENVQRTDLLGRPCDLRCVGDIECQRCHPWVGDL